MHTSNNKTPAEFHQELLDLLTQQGLPQTISAFKKSISNRSEAYRIVVEMEVQYKELQREFFGGQISKENESVESNRLTKSFINLIERLETEPELLSARKANQRKALRWGLPFLLVILSLGLGYWFWGSDTSPKPTVGKVLYTIPAKMQVGKETECVVRISPEKLTNVALSVGLPDTASKKIESIRIGDVMTADLVGAEDAFRVTLKSTREQPIEEDNYTEWKFDVVPLKEGIHGLTLKITVKLMMDEYGEVIKDALVLDRDVEIVSEPVTDIASLEEGGYLQLTDDLPSVIEKGEEPAAPEPVTPDPGPDKGDKGKEPKEDDILDPDKTTGNTPPSPKPNITPNRPGKVSFCVEGFDLKVALNTFAQKIERKNIPYNSESLSDCSGIFLRLCTALKEECPGMVFPDALYVRSSRQIAGWFADQGTLNIIEDATAVGKDIRPGMVFFYGTQGKTYQNPTIDELVQAGGIEHVGVVVSVEKDAAGKVTNYALFHGRSGDKPAGRTSHHHLNPSRADLPPYGNGDQQLVAAAFVLTQGKGI